MPEFRQNFVTKEWVIVAPERGKRPDQMRRDDRTRPALPDYREDCPFCPGHEDRTPEPTYVWEAGGHWQVRVVPNKFAALAATHSPHREAVGPFLRAGGYGLAEVVIESPHHDRSLETLAADEVEAVLRAFRSRHLAIAALPRINLVSIFRNYGALAGTSLEHPHSQIIATPIVPPHVRDPWRHAQLHFDTFGRCAYCEMIEGEAVQQVRMLQETDHFVAFEPFAAKTPFETRIYPKRHHASFSWINDREIRDLAPLLRATLLRLRRGLGAPDYNFIIRSAGSGDEDVKHLHWYLVIIPRITNPAGFEIGSGIYINVVAPETAAEFLRGVAVSEPE
jgi:UDPglucose--hexose-1-phosphate uridylyltransferase